MSVKKKLQKQTGNNAFTVRKQSLGNGETEITFTFADIQKSNGTRYDDKEKRKVIDIVCYAYINGVPVENMCNQLGVSFMTFYRWVNPTSKQAFPYGVEKYNEAKETLRFIVNETDVFTARAKLQSKLTLRKVTNTTLHYETRGVHGEEVVLKGKTEHERMIEPDLQAISLVLSNLDDDFSKKRLEQKQMDDLEIEYMTAEQIQIEIDKERARKALLDSSLDE